MKMKQVLWLFTVRMAIVLIFGNAVVGFTPVAVADVPVSASTPVGTSPLVSGWIQTNWPASNSFFSLYTNRDKVFARIWDSLNGGRMFLTTDDGANWTQISSADSDIDILSIVMLNSNILAGTWNGFYLSTDGGTTWDALTPTGIPADTAIWSIVMINATLFAGTTGDIYKSLDNGNTWTEVNSGIPVNARITSIVASGDAIFAGSTSNGIFKTTNGGTSWTEINSGLTDTHICQLVVLGTRLFAVTLGGVFISDNNGTSWAADSSGLENVNCLAVVNNQLFAGTDDDGVYLSVDSGVTWTSFSSGMPADTRIWSLAVSSDGIFAGTSSGVWVTDPPRVLVETKIFLEGPYNAGINEMTTSLTIPIDSPYSEDPRTVSNVPTDVTDWVLVQLRSTVDGLAAASKSALLHKDGRVVADDGTTGQITLEAAAGDYYIVIKHRNHLSVISAATEYLSSGSSTSYDFTTGTAKYYGTDAALLEEGVYGMYTGDASGNDQVQNDDKNDYWKAQVGTAGYRSADFNLNGEVQNDDKNDYWKNNVGRGTQVP